MYSFIGIPRLYAIPTLIGAGILALIMVEKYRRAHKYIVTNRRIIFQFNGIFKKTGEM